MARRHRINATREEWNMHLTEIDGAALSLRGAGGLDALPDSVRHLRAQLDPPARHGREAPAVAGLGVAVRGMGKRFGERRVLEALDLDIVPGSFVAVVGRSGCGKSTLLRLLAALDEPSAGTITLDGAPVASHRKDLRIMFQEARLLPWKRVIDNVALGLSAPGAQAQARAALEQVGLAERAQDWPAVLSGGQRQRVALARALVHQPRLLLLDEPLGALDALTRIEMHRLIERLWLEHGFTALLVTHDVGEAVALADRVLLVENGGLALDVPVTLPRPRRRGDAALAALEAQVLGRVLHEQGAAPGKPQPEVAAEPDPLEVLRYGG
jgi:sulfonate transport system ATP-binding protein